jgi:Secretion system C-terminal sorting domain
MKSFCALILTLVVTSFHANAQRYADLEVHQINPTGYQILESAQTFPLKFNIVNLGPDSILFNDTIRTQWLLDNGIFLFNTGTSIDSFFTFTSIVISPLDSVEVTMPSNFIFTGKYKFCNKILLYESTINPVADTNLSNNQDCAIIEVNPLSVQNAQSPNEIILFPNPSTNYMYIKGLPINSKFSYTILDCFGRKLLTSSCASESDYINLTSLPTGLYSIQLETEGSKIVRTIMKQ